MSICVAYIRFHAALRAQCIDRAQLHYRSPFQPYLAWAGLLFFALITLFNGWDSIAGKWDYQAFITSYIGFPIFFGLYAVWKLVKKSPWIKSEQADLMTGKTALDAVEWPVKRPKNWAQRVWFWIA
jgi:yeast amino acid transporter